MESNFKKVTLDQISENPGNPRTISEYKLDQLINSLLIFPRMLELRPIVVDEDGAALGGNMRRRGLEKIGAMSESELSSRLGEIVKVQSEKDDLLKYWKKWRVKKEVPVICAGDLTEEQRQEFIIKDNIAFGAWDKEKLAGWEKDQLEDWGLDGIEWEMPKDSGDSGSVGGKKDISTKLEVECEDLEKLASLFSELQDRGFKCKLI